MLKKLWYYFFPPEFLKQAKIRRELLRKVYFYRRNQLTEDQKRELSEMAVSVRAAYTAFDKEGLAKLIKPCDKLLSRLGSHYYHRYHWYENTEVFVVAAILAIGIRSYFLQPFKIPTNSMWPTYYGMTYHLRTPGQGAPDSLAAAWRFVWLGCTQHTAIAQDSGEILVPVFSEAERAAHGAIFRYRVATQPFLGILPVKVRAYDFFVNGTTSTIFVPYEYTDMDRLILEKFFPDSRNSANSGEGTPLRISLDNYAATGIEVQKGTPILSFELETGDMLFVDRVSYYFNGPTVGDPIVFRTRNIEGLTRLNHGVPDDKYYIKRLAGYNGDTISIQKNDLVNNGVSMAEKFGPKSIFAKNATQTPPYRGYAAVENLADGVDFKVPADFCFALGDNSTESLDSRYWGPFDQRELVGRAVFIYYPFSYRWGISH
jgi:signal peptidase I